VATLEGHSKSVRRDVPFFVLLLSVFVVGPLRCCVSERAARPICVGQDLEVVGGVEILSLAPRGESD